MKILLALFILLIAIHFLTKIYRKKRSLVRITTKSKDTNVSEITINLNEKEFAKRLRKGTLGGRATTHQKSIEDITGFYGTTNYSTTKEYSISFCDSYHDGEHLKNGKIALLKGETLLFKKTLQRPNECHVSNDGIVVCCDWLNTDALAGLFIIFKTNGERIYSQKTTANLGASAISTDSSIAVFETYGSETEDSNTVFIIDTGQKRIVNKFLRPHAFNTIDIDTKAKTLDLIDHNGFHFKVDFDGNQTNRDDYEKQVFTRGSIYDKLRLYESKPDELRLTDKKYIELLVAALSDKDALYGFGEDKLYRKLGEYYEANGDIPKTIENWEKALQINPKVGIKRKLETLKKT